jgi:hypothetical protein
MRYARAPTFEPASMVLMVTFLLAPMACFAGRGRTSEEGPNLLATGTRNLGAGNFRLAGVCPRWFP